MPESNLDSPVRFVVSHEADTYRCSTKVKALAASIGYSPEAQWEIAIALCELISNAVRYAGHGHVTVSRISRDRCGIEIRVEDSGPGLHAERASLPIRRGLGAGLSAVSRLMDEVRVESEIDKGTVVVARKWLDKEA